MKLSYLYSLSYDVLFAIFAASFPGIVGYCNKYGVSMDYHGMVVVLNKGVK